MERDLRWPVAEQRIEVAGNPHGQCPDKAAEVGPEQDRAVDPSEARKNKPLGFVDKSIFLDLLPNEDAIRVEVSIHKSLIQLICSGLEADLKDVVCGLESIDTLVLDVGGRLRDDMASLVPRVDRKLQDDGWERIVLVREPSEQVRILVYNDEESISGLVVMVIDQREMVFVNVSGLIDLEAMQKLANRMDIPGLEHLEDIEGYQGRDRND